MDVSFHDREREMERVMKILNSRPDLITFVYGPINSGKTELFQQLVSSLPNEFVVFYVNLRGKFIRNYEDFIRVLFKFRRESREDILRDILKETVKVFGGVPVPELLLDAIFGREEREDVFEFLEELFMEISRKKKPVLILDELQVIGDLKIDDFLIYKLFNLFVRLTKELHVCHVFAITSDSLFMERVYTEASLHGRCRYLLVDDFDYETTKSFLEKYGFSEDEIKLAWEYFGGKPVYLVEAVRERDRLREFCEEMLRIRKRQIKDSIYSLDEDFRRAVLDIFARFREEERITYEYLTEELVWCMKNNILFLDPVNELVKPQSRLDLLALRRLLGELNS